MKVSHILAATAAGLQLVQGLTLDVTSADSIRTAASTVVHGLMNYYANNQSSTAAVSIGTFSPPLATWYWWEAGAVWGALIDYWAYTGDTTYMSTVTEALLAQVGDDNDYMPSYYAGSMGNDDQAFWAAAALTALEYGYPEPPNGTVGSPSWQSLSEAVWNNLASRWNDTQCGGGLKWQVYPQNAGYDYKQTISNAGFFQISARLARYTGNSTYYDWAVKSWDWMNAIGLVSTEGEAFDGTDDTMNCTTINHIEWTYNSGMLMYGAASLYSYSGSDVWSARTTTLLSHAEKVFFNTFENASGILVEQACEPHYTCNNDQWSFKAYIARWMAKTAILVPSTKATIMPLLTTSAQAAAQACSGPSDGVTCGARWYIGGYDGSYGIGQQLSALEVMQALLIDDAPEISKGTELVPKISTSTSSTSTSNTSASSTSIASTSVSSTSTSSTSTITTTSSTTSTSTTSTSTTSTSTTSTSTTSISTTPISTTGSSMITFTTTSASTTGISNTNTSITGTELVHESSTKTNSSASHSSTSTSTSSKSTSTTTHASATTAVATATPTPSKGAASGGLYRRGSDGTTEVAIVAVVLQVCGILLGLGFV